MDFFGLTQYGFSDTFKSFMRPDYKEPDTYLDMAEIDANLYIGKLKRPFAEAVKELDCYIGYANGYAYKSNDRLMRMRRKSMFKPVGPCDMYLYPGTNSMNYGWWNQDPKLKVLIEDNWHLPIERFPAVRSDMTRFLDYCLRSNKYFKM